MQTFLRRLEILNFLAAQRAAKRTAVGTEVIVEHLRDAGYLEASSEQRRSQFRLVQRDMQFLLGEEFDGEAENDFGLQAERGDGKSLLWSLEPYQALHYDFERMPAYMALAMHISQKHLKQVIPRQARQELALLFDGAESKLQKTEKKLSKKHYRRLTNAVEFYQRGQSLQAPEYQPAVLDQIYQAILLGRRIDIRYQTRDGLKDYNLHPYGVAIMLPKLYLIARKTDAPDLDEASENPYSDAGFRSFLIHRIESVLISPFSNHVPNTFELKYYLEQGYMDVLIDPNDRGMYQLELQLNLPPHSNLAQDLQDSPVSKDQVLTSAGNGSWTLNATVRRTVQIRNWLLSLGPQAKVQAPAILKQDLIAHLDRMRANYP
ncbi:MAG: WYL domain-containing protein [Oleiphilus sp.]|nr:MAG: WYL domain-containing protein [Oleiphilus sp.]